jgi:citrate synthase
LWTGDSTRGSELFSGSEPALPTGLPDARLFTRFQVLMPLAAAADPAAWDLRTTSLPHTGARIVRAMVAVAAPGARGHLAERLASAWNVDSELISASLILCADHELNVSAFTARCVASAHATLYDVVGAGLAALRGARHGGHTERTEVLLAEAAAIGPQRAISDRLRRGEAVPGFGHPLYPDGDPRARYLLDRLTGREAELARGVAEAGRSLLGEHPTIDLGLAAVGRELALPEGGPLVLFALGRTIGWIGHAIEQVADGHLIRPRARYDGPPARVVQRSGPG